MISFWRAKSKPVPPPARDMAALCEELNLQRERLHSETMESLDSLRLQSVELRQLAEKAKDGICRNG